MNNTWIKLYRKTTENGILRDHTAWAVFSWLLLMVDKDTGKRTVGRFQMADELKIKPNTLYKVLHRLEKKWGVIKMDGQMKFTEILILNWTKYQMTVNNESNDSQKSVKSASSAGNTKQEIENKELEKEEEEKIPNRLALLRGQINAYLKEYPGLTLEELKEQQAKCNRQMNMSSGNYGNPGLYFNGWLKHYIEEKKLAEHKKELSEKPKVDTTDIPEISEEQRQRNIERISDIKKNLINRI